MRARWLLIASALAACSSGPTKEDRDLVARGRIQVIHQQYYRGSRPTVVENAAGRDVVKLRSRPLMEGDRYVTYVDDDAMSSTNEPYRPGSSRTIPRAGVGCFEILFRQRGE